MLMACYIILETGCEIDSIICKLYTLVILLHLKQNKLETDDTLEAISVSIRIFISNSTFYSRVFWSSSSLHFKIPLQMLRFIFYNLIIIWR